MSEAKQVAVHLDAFRVADRSLDSHHVCSIEAEEESKSESEKKLNGLCDKVSKVVEEMSKFKTPPKTPMDNHHAQSNKYDFRNRKKQKWNKKQGNQQGSNFQRTEVRSNPKGPANNRQ